MWVKGVPFKWQHCCDTLLLCGLLHDVNNGLVPSGIERIYWQYLPPKLHWLQIASKCPTTHGPIFLTICNGVIIAPSTESCVFPVLFPGASFMTNTYSYNILRPRQNCRISQTTFSNAFSWMKMYEFRLRFHWTLFLRFESTIFQHWFR